MPATLEEGLFALLNASPDLRALTFNSVPFFDGTNCRIYPGTIDENSVLPALAYARVGGVSKLTMGGPDRLPSVRFQFTSAAETYADNVPLINALLNLLDGFRGQLPNGVVVQLAQSVMDPIDSFSAEARLFSRHCDIAFRYEEPSQ